MDIKMKVRAIVNKKNGQTSVSIPKKQLPDILKSNPPKFYKIKICGWE